CGTRLLGVQVGKNRALVGDAIDIGRAVSHHAPAVGADVPHADVIAKDNQDVRRLLCRLRLNRGWEATGRDCNEYKANQAHFDLWPREHVLPFGETRQAFWIRSQTLPNSRDTNPVRQNIANQFISHGTLVQRTTHSAWCE